MGKRKKASFKLNCKDLSGQVYFKRFNGKVIKCYLKDDFFGTTYVGIAKCNPRDIFEEEEGMSLAYERALDKWANKQFVRMNSIKRDITRVLDVGLEIFEGKIERCNLKCGR